MAENTAAYNMAQPDTTMSNGIHQQETNPAINGQLNTHIETETPASPYVGTPIEADLADPTVTQTMDFTSGMVEPAPTPAVEGMNSSHPVGLHNLDTTLASSTASALPIASALPTADTPTTPAVSNPQPTTTKSHPNGTTTPARSATPVPGAATTNLPPSAIIPSRYSGAEGDTAGPGVGSPTRVYINGKVTPVLLEGMKWVAKNEPEKPLRWLGEYLLRRSEEVEGA